MKIFTLQNFGFPVALHLQIFKEAMFVFNLQIRRKGEDLRVCSATNTQSKRRFRYGDVFYFKILMKARLRSEVELYLQIQAEDGSSWRLHFTGSRRGYVLRIRFPFRKRNSATFTEPNLGFRVVTDSHKHYTQMITLIQAFGSVILLLLFIFAFPHTTDNSIHSLVTILRVAINVGNLAFHMAADRS
jgi:hypothetical protein